MQLYIKLNVRQFIIFWGLYAFTFGQIATTDQHFRRTLGLVAPSKAPHRTTKSDNPPTDSLHDKIVFESNADHPRVFS